MSDSELSDAPSHATPSDATLETELRRVVRDAIKQDEDITVRLARARVEEQLGLEADFFTNDEWKKRSKDIITAAVDEPESPAKAKPKAGRKRKSDEPAKKPTKRAKKSPVVESEEDDDDMDESMGEENEEEEEEEEKPKRKPRAQAKAKPPPKAKAKPKPKTKAKTSSPVVESDEDEENEAPKVEPEAKAATIDSEAEDEQPQTSETLKPDDEKSTSTPKPSDPADEDNDSDMSVLIDDPPPKKKGGRAKKSTSPGTTTKKTTKKAATTAASSKDLSPDDEEIKRLQSWLIKCGIRKLWHRELADDKFPTSKAKIAHLKSMLTDAGMTGRFSAEKAKSIKESRELEAELEAARDFEEKFGTGGRGRRAKKNSIVKDQGSDDEDDGDEGEQEDGEKAEGAKRPGGRLLPKGLVDFGDSGDDGSD
jgi:hypothetical protein